MRKIVLILILIFVPILASAYTADDFTVNRQSTYAVPPGTTRVLILDLTSPQPIDSIKIINAGTAQQTDISKISVFGDGSSAGWDGDETEAAVKSQSPFWDAWLTGFSQTRIFITVDIASGAASERTIKPQLEVNAVKFDSGAVGPTDKEITGFERTISTEAAPPTVPVTPLAGAPEALSASTIRWHFDDRSNNEFGFKILDSSLNEKARDETADISYIDETGLKPDTEYSGRRVIAFNDRGESLSSPLSIFSTARTLVEEIEPASAEEEMIEEEVEEEIAVVEEAEEEVVKEPSLSLLETIQQKIAEIQQKINELLEQLNELLQQQAATIWTAFSRFFQSLFPGK